MVSVTIAKLKNLCDVALFLHYGLHSTKNSTNQPENQLIQRRKGQDFKLQIRANLTSNES